MANKQIRHGPGGVVVGGTDPTGHPLPPIFDPPPVRAEHAAVEHRHARHGASGCVDRRLLCSVALISFWTGALAVDVASHGGEWVSVMFFRITLRSRPALQFVMNGRKVADVR